MIRHTRAHATVPAPTEFDFEATSLSLFTTLRASVRPGADDAPLLASRRASAAGFVRPADADNDPACPVSRAPRLAA